MTNVFRASRRQALAVALGAIATHAVAQPAPARARLLRGAPGGAELFAGVEIALNPGWKTYWRVPGDSGIPPRFDFSASINLADAEVLYPAPARFSDGYGEILGYSADVVFPLRVRAIRPDAPVTLAITLDFGVCERVCIPMQTRLNATLGQLSPPAQDVSRIARTLARVPRAVPAGTAVREFGFNPSSTRLTLLADLPGGVDHVIVEAARELPLPLPGLNRLEDGRVRAELSIAAPVPSEVLVTAIGPREAVEERRNLDR